ncbi:MAG: proline racemase family protein [Armatimonadetes bacterium]|nr:proline racemase family protein [Armatimonadota bacterium]
MQIEVIDSHTGGEPTRVVVGGWDIPQGATCAEKRDDLRKNQTHLRTAVILEPRGSDVVVGALLVPPSDPSCCTGVIFFNNVDTLGMCGHGTIGVVETLRHLGRIQSGTHKIETPVGVVEVKLDDDGNVWVTNVPAFVHQLGATVETPNYGTITGDIVWGGNWFFLIQRNAFIPEILFENRTNLMDFTTEVRESLEAAGITGRGGDLIDHIEVFGLALVEGANSKNFVLCPGMAYDRSPCGTGTCAKMASLVARGKLSPGKRWIQESITGSTFTGYVDIDGETVIPHISGRAHITAKSTLILDENDPFRWGIV